jgi:hypothetical protein
MSGPKSVAQAIRSMVDLFGPAKRWDDEKIDEWLRQFTDVIIEDLDRLNGKGGMS